MPPSAEPVLPPPTPDASAHSRELAEHIAGAIVAEGEWIPFSRYMELALYAPGLGYYAAGARKFGSDGDFVTSPEISPMFAKCFALQAAQVLKAVGGDILELGPGSGVFAADLFETLKELGEAPQRYRLLEVGVAIFIDYGLPEREYYHPQRSMGTLRCHYRHRVHGDPFFMPGLQDITAHVDFSAMARAAEQGGAEVYGLTTQAYFLISCGLAVLVSAGDPTMTLSRLKGTSAVHRLIAPSEMGELFKVLGFGKGIEQPILGFQSARHLQL